jgi:hypothetical protein
MFLVVSNISAILLTAVNRGHFLNFLLRPAIQMFIAHMSSRIMFGSVNGHINAIR